jgi:hypothetical protein
MSIFVILAIVTALSGPIVVGSVQGGGGPS